MWPFKKAPRVGTLSNVAFARWLRAGSPQPLVEFLTYGEDEQETLATIGDDHADDAASTNAEALGEIIQAIVAGLMDPAAAPVAEAAGDEGDFAADLALGALGAQGPQIRSGAKPGPRPLTMGGVTERRSQRIKADQDDADAPKRLLGLLPDSMRPPKAPPEDPPEAVEEAAG